MTDLTGAAVAGGEGRLLRAGPGRQRLGVGRRARGSGCWRTVLGRALAGPSRPRQLRPSWAGGLAWRETRASGENGLRAE